MSQMFMGSKLVEAQRRMFGGDKDGDREKDRRQR